CEPTGRRKAPPDDKPREPIHISITAVMDCFVAEFIIGPAQGGTRWLLAMTKDLSPVRERALLLLRRKPHASCFDIAEHTLDSVRRPVDGDRLGGRRRHHGHTHCPPALGAGRVQHRRLYVAALRPNSRAPRQP